MEIYTATEENGPILVELYPAPGLKQVAASPQDLAEKSAQALASAMRTIQYMSATVMDTIDVLANRPSNVAVEFGLKLDTAGHAIIASVGAECTLNVKLTWERKELHRERETSERSPTKSS